MNNNQITENQHTVSACYLSSFSNNGWVFVYNKTHQSWKKKHINAISRESFIYEHDDYEINEIENKLGKFEDKWSKDGRDRLIENFQDNNYVLTEYDKILMGKFIWLQMTKTKSSLNMYDMYERFLIENDVENNLLNDFKSIDTKKVFLDIITNPKYELEFLKKKWVVFKTNDSMHEFFISDTPVINDGSHINGDYTINFFLTPKILIQLRDSHRKLVDRIYKISPSKIIYYNKLQIVDSFNEIYVRTSQQKKFIERKRKLTKIKKINTLKEYPSTTDNSSLLIGGVERTGKL